MPYGSRCAMPGSRGSAAPAAAKERASRAAIPRERTSRLIHGSRGFRHAVGLSRASTTSYVADKAVDGRDTGERNRHRSSNGPCLARTGEKLLRLAEQGREALLALTGELHDTAARGRVARRPFQIGETPHQGRTQGSRKVMAALAP